MNNFKWKNLYKPGTAEYYRDQLNNIVSVGFNYDGCNKKDAKQMKDLVDALVKMAKQALNHEHLYLEYENS